MWEQRKILEQCPDGMARGGWKHYLILIHKPTLSKFTFAH